MRRYHLLLPGRPGWPSTATRLTRRVGVDSKYSPYQNCAGSALPPVLVTPRPGRPGAPRARRKMVARMQEYGHRVEYYENIEAATAGGGQRAAGVPVGARARVLLARGGSRARHAVTRRWGRRDPGGEARGSGRDALGQQCLAEQRQYGIADRRARCDHCTRRGPRPLQVARSFSTIVSRSPRRRGRRRSGRCRRRRSRLGVARRRNLATLYLVVRYTCRCSRASALACGVGLEQHRVLDTRTRRRRGCRAPARCAPR